MKLLCKKRLFVAACVEGMDTQRRAQLEYQMHNVSECSIRGASHLGEPRERCRSMT
jgi:hypothetical protein